MSNGNPAPPREPPPQPSGPPSSGGDLSSLGKSLRDAVSIPIGGGTLEPAKSW